MSIVLDIVRGMAAIAVLIGHAVQLGIYSGPWPFEFSLQHNAVIVFFVLSGILIMNSAQKHAGPAEFIVSRFCRIIPATIICLLFSVAVYACIGSVLPAIAEDMQSLSIVEIVRTALFLGQYNSSVAPIYNPPLWSLTYEIWFYIFFAAVVFSSGPWRIIAAILCLCLAGWQITIMLPSWLMEVMAAKVKVSRSSRTIFIFIACVISLISFCAFQVHYRFYGMLLGISVDVKAWRFSSYAFTDALLAFLISCMFIFGRVLLPNDLRVPETVRHAARMFAGSSFSLYLIHWPIIIVMHHAGLRAGEDVPMFLAILTLPVAAALIMAPCIEGVAVQRLKHFVAMAVERNTCRRSMINQVDRIDTGNDHPCDGAVKAVS